jgi:predicted acyltransferase
MSSQKTETSGHQTNRVISLDAFRGLTIIGMLLVNNAALDVFTPKHLTHALWNQGINFADLVFPWFLFIVGVAIPFSYISHKKKELSYGRWIGKAVSRAVLLLLIGCFLDSSIARQPVVGLGVLQIIGLAFMIAAILYGLSIYWRLAIAAIFLLMHWYLLRFVAIADFGPGIASETQNVIYHLNTNYLQYYHLKGLISVIPTSALVIIGSLVGNLIETQSLKNIKKLLIMIAIGSALTSIGWLWHLDLPFNKPLWTSSYILASAGLGCLVLGIFYLLADVKNWHWLAYPFIIFGANAIAAYVLPILVKVYILQVWTLKSIDGTNVSIQQSFMNWLNLSYKMPVAGWIYTITYIVIWWFILFYMYKKKMFLKI